MRASFWALAAPALAGALWLVADDVARTLRAPARADSFAEAIRNDGPEQVYALIRAGQDPNAPVTFSHPDLTGDREIHVVPIVLAVATHNDNVVMTLMSVGATLTEPRGSNAVCLARRLGYDDIATLIVRDAPIRGTVTCPPAVNSTYPLLDFTDQSGP